MSNSLRARLTLGLALIAAALLVMSAVALRSLHDLGGAVDRILRENYRSVIACGEMLDALERQDSAAMFAAAGRDDLARPMLRANRDAFVRALAVEAGNITLPGEGELVSSLRAGYDGYTRAVDDALAAPPTTRHDAYFRTLLPRFAALKSTLARVRGMNQAHMERADREARALSVRGARVTGLAAAVALALTLWLAWRVPLVVLRPVRRFVDVARDITEGRLDGPVPDPGVRELTPLADALTAMRDALRSYRDSALGELHDARALSEATMRCLLDPVVVLDDRGGVALANDAATRAFGLTAGDAEALRRNEIALPPAFAAARDEVLSTGASLAPRSLSDATRWGERWFLVRAAPLREGDGAARRVIVVAEDVTRLRRIDALKSDIVATVSHEFKTPLTSLRMATHLLLEPATGPLNDDQREVLTSARDDTERLRALVDELLDLVRIESEAGAPRRVAVEPRRLLERCAEAHRSLAREKGVTLTVLDGDVAAVEVDPERVGIALANLTSNALRHTPAGGRVTLAAEDLDDRVRLTIRDTGEGVAKGDLARLLDPSAPRRASSHADGHGLGLAIAHEIVLQHGGVLDARSEPGSGSAFALTLPRGG
jgi:signal transduction histidine kinase